MAEMEGPGCIFRIWSARAQAGHVKIYLDGQEQPVLDRPFIEYFTGKTAPLDYPALCYEMKEQDSRGENLYLPIPYQKSCKIVAEKGWGAYYHFTYTTFPEGTKVPTFQAKLSPPDAAALAKLNEFLANKLGTDPAGTGDGQKTIAEQVTIGAGEYLFLDIPGPRAITAIRGKMEFKDREDEMAALRRLVLRITFDGSQQPAVWCPLGDFFGTAPGENHYRTLMTGMTDDGTYAYWYMPFAQREGGTGQSGRGRPGRGVRDRPRPAFTAAGGLGPFSLQMASRRLAADCRPLSRLDDVADRGPGPVLRGDAARLESPRRLVG